MNEIIEWAKEQIAYLTPLAQQFRGEGIALVWEGKIEALNELIELLEEKCST